jgi:hypothetical protein
LRIYTTPREKSNAVFYPFPQSSYGDHVLDLINDSDLQAKAMEDDCQIVLIPQHPSA